MQPGNHGPQAGSICKKTRPKRPQAGKYECFTQPKTYSGSEAWEFFTDDGLQQPEQDKAPPNSRRHPDQEDKIVNAFKQHAAMVAEIG